MVNLQAVLQCSEASIDPTFSKLDRIDPKFCSRRSRKKLTAIIDHHALMGTIPSAQTSHKAVWSSGMASIGTKAILRGESSP